MTYKYVGLCWRRCCICDKLYCCEKQWPKANDLIYYKGRYFCFGCFGAVPAEFWEKMDVILGDDSGEITLSDLPQSDTLDDALNGINDGGSLALEQFKSVDQLINYWIVTDKIPD